MNDHRSLICWSPHARGGLHSPHGQEFLVCSSTIRLFRVGTNSSNNNEPHKSNSFASPTLAPQTAALRASNDGVALYQPHTYDAVDHAPRTSFHLLDSISYPGQSFKCIGWSHGSSTPYMVAAGQISGKLVVMNFATPNGNGSSNSGTHDTGASNANSSDATSRIVKEFHPRYARACHVACWNPVHTSQVAAGLDRVRNGCGTLIWDVEQKGAAVAVATAAPLPAQSNSSFVGSSSAASNILNTNRSTAPTTQAIETVTEPLGRVSNSEATLSLNWLPSDPFSLAVGTGFKWLRIYDIRGNSRPTSVVAHAKSVNGVSFDPFNSMRLATFSEEGTIKIWDLRMITRREIFSIHSSPTVAPGRTPKTLLEVEWCPTSQHRIATVHREEEGFRLWDLSGSLPNLPPPSASLAGSPLSPIHDDATLIVGSSGDSVQLSTQQDIPTSSSDGATDSAPSRSIPIACLSGVAGGTGGQLSPPASLSSLSWHPSAKQRVLAITSHGLVEDIALHESIPCGWGSGGPAFAVDEQLFVGRLRPGLNNAGDGGEPTGAVDKDAALTTLLAPASDPTSILTFDVSTRMRVRAAIGYGLDVSLNSRVTRKVIDALYANTASVPLAATPLAASAAAAGQTIMCVDAMKDEEACARVWEWMMQTERLAAATQAATQPPTAASGGVTRKNKFAGVLASLLPGGLSRAAALVSHRPIGSLAPAHGGPTGTLLSILKNEDATGAAAGASLAGGASGLQLTPPSTSHSTNIGGFLPGGFQIYLSRSRSEAMRLCDGWFDLFSSPGGDSAELVGAPGPARAKAANSISSPAHFAYERHLSHLESCGLYEQAARIAIFHLDLERALSSLTLGARDGGGKEGTKGLGLVAMALSGYANFAANQNTFASNGVSAQTLWTNTWSSALGQEGTAKMSPALLSIFRFLSASSSGGSTAGTSFASLLSSSDLSLSDQVGFMLRFLPDDELITGLIQAMREKTAKGDLDGLLLVGLNNIEQINTTTTNTTTGTEVQPTQQTTWKSYTLDLLQSYLDRTSDIQTSAILGCFAGVAISFPSPPPASAAVAPFDPSVDPSIPLTQWIQLYRSLLNQWSLWSDRAKFDVSRALLEKSWVESETSRSKTTSAVKRPPHHTQVKPQISVRCNFCGQSLSLESMSGGSGGPGSSGGGPPGLGGAGRAGGFRPRGRVGAGRVPDQNSVRIRGCPHCKKSLPRCALCLVSFDCDTPQSGPSQPLKPRKKNPAVDGQEEDITPGCPNTITAGNTPATTHVEDDTRFDSNTMHAFGKWFTWCQACRHGGHAEHMADWFQQHSECPVTDCRCRCMSLDLLSSRNGSNGMLKAIERDTHDASEREEKKRQVEAMQQANAQLAIQQSQFHMQMNLQEPTMQQQSIAMAQIQQQYPNGLPLDVLAVAQAIQLMNLTRGSNTPLMSGSLGPGMMSTPDGAIASGVQSQFSSPGSVSTPAPLPMPLPHASPSQSPPYAILDQPTVLPTAASAQNLTNHNETNHHTHTGHTHTNIPRAVSSVQLGSKQAKQTFPLTRW